MAFTASSKAQQLSFRHLGIDEGLPSNVTYQACFDSTGFVWMATNDGLISYDGIRTRQYLKETHPGLPVNEIGYLFCDSRNRIWICTSEGLALMDEQRRINSVVLHDSLKKADINYCFEAGGAGMVVIGAKKTYLLPAGKTEWEPLGWFDDNIRKGAGISNLRVFNKTTYLFMMKSRVMLVDFAAKKVLTDVAIPNTNIGSLCRLNDNELLAVNNRKFELYRISIGANAITKTYSGIYDDKGDKIQASPVSCTRAANGLVYIATRFGGLISFDIDKAVFTAYRHDPLNTNSISSDNLRWMGAHPNGYILIASAGGLNFCNVLITMFPQKKIFVDATGKIMDGGITGIAEDANQKIWLKNVSRLLIWDPHTQAVRRIQMPPALVSGIETTTSAGIINRDDRNNMWVAYSEKGLAKYDVNGKLLQFLHKENGTLPGNTLRIIKQLPNRMMMAGAVNGLYMLHPETYRIDSFDADPLLKTIAHKRIIDIMPDGENKVWIAISPGGGAYCYDFKNKTLKTFTIANGLSSERVYCIGKDFYNNIYIGTFQGLNIISPSGKITIINKANGLRHARVENIVTDRDGKLWITNFNSLTRYNPATETFIYFDEQNGVSNAGFSTAVNAITNDGKIIFSNGGLLIVDPLAVQPQQESGKPVAVHRLYDDGGYELLPAKGTVKLDYDNAKITLYYLSSTLFTANRFFYRYRMQGMDTGWQQPTKNNQVTFNLNPGQYTFRIQAAFNEGNWKENDIAITIVVASPWWQTWWFRLIVLLAAAGIVYTVFRSRVKVIRSKAAVEQQLAELESKALRAQMNPHFIFNSLNAIQELIVTKNVTEAYQYLSRFSKLLRMVLNNSEKNFISLSEEVEMNRHYLELESLRFKKSFYYEMRAAENIDEEATLVPSLLLQPFIENAIWHGLISKEGEKRLEISFETQGENIICTIEDNGIGRKKSAAIKAGKIGASHIESKGMKLSHLRIELLNHQLKEKLQIKVEDVVDGDRQPAGTRVVITIPNQTSFKTNFND